MSLVVIDSVNWKGECDDTNLHEGFKYNFELGVPLS